MLTSPARRTSEPDRQRPTASTICDGERRPRAARRRAPAAPRLIRHFGRELARRAPPGDACRRRRLWPVRAAQLQRRARRHACANRKSVAGHRIDEPCCITGQQQSRIADGPRSPRRADRARSLPRPGARARSARAAPGRCATATSITRLRRSTRWAPEHASRAPERRRRWPHRRPAARRRCSRRA